MKDDLMLVLETLKTIVQVFEEYDIGTFETSSDALETLESCIDEKITEYYLQDLMDRLNQH